jgi:Retroviral aspartyl protease
MIRYGYNQQFAPPAPFVHVTIRSRDGAKEVGELPALLDTAADKSVIPLRVVNELNLVKVREASVEGVGGHVERYPTFLVQLAIRSLPPVVVEVLATPEEAYVLLGRDVLNHFRVFLHGPDLAVEIS